MVVLLVKIFCFFISAVFLFHTNTVVAYGNGIDISAESAIVMVASTGEVVYSKNEYLKRGIASTTKIMTSVVALESASLSQKTIAKKEDVYIEGTSIGLKPGDVVDTLTLLKGMLLESGNDAANVTATLVAGGKEPFSVLMNKKAKEIGMNNSCFQNPSGLTEENHYSCAYDMALLGSYAIKNKVFKNICSAQRFTVTIGGNQSYEKVLYNHNKLLSKYDGAIGIKTGFTKASGRCLVSAAERGGVTLVAVTLNAYDDWNDHIKMYEYSFPLVKKQKIKLPVNNITLPVVSSKKKEVELKLSKDIYISYIDDVPQYTISWYLPHFVYGGIKKGDYIGWVELYTSEGIFIDKAYIVSGEKIDALSVVKKQSFTEKILKFIEKDRR